MPLLTARCLSLCTHQKPPRCACVSVRMCDQARACVCVCDDREIMRGQLDVVSHKAVGFARYLPELQPIPLTKPQCQVSATRQHTHTHPHTHTLRPRMHKHTGVHPHHSLGSLLFYWNSAVWSAVHNRQQQRLRVGQGWQKCSHCKLAALLTLSTSLRRMNIRSKTPTYTMGLRCCASASRCVSEGKGVGRAPPCALS